MTYASQTKVSVEKTRGEIEKLLKGAGATHFGFATEPQQAVIQVILKDRHVRFYLPLPAQDEKRFRMTPAGRAVRSQASQLEAWEQACRSRWRALLLSIKAKLEAIREGIATFDEEFLSNVVDRESGRNVGHLIIPDLQQRNASIGKTHGPLRLGHSEVRP